MWVSGEDDDKCRLFQYVSIYKAYYFLHLSHSSTEAFIASNGIHATYFGKVAEIKHYLTYLIQINQVMYAMACAPHYWNDKILTKNHDGPCHTEPFFTLQVTQQFC